ncbi:uncharacterized protein LOC104894407 isoform X2 [Beta vulgaris subsp. vulgaris]|uniref:uncharacterized protein LOC104894407 isoform X2 n=1 Tax=Beta vulgaris subsp. vulgaris TaxID=3555 RepID=UPI000901EFCD|nr:uncharacterized protein LOC104894407 isoform X2 [Beta vulgaris subsp. vulgaris]
MDHHRHHTHHHNHHPHQSRQHHPMDPPPPPSSSSSSSSRYFPLRPPPPPPSFPDDYPNSFPPQRHLPPPPPPPQHHQHHHTLSPRLLHHHQKPFDDFNFINSPPHHHPHHAHPLRHIVEDELIEKFRSPPNRVYDNHSIDVDVDRHSRFRLNQLPAPPPPPPPPPHNSRVGPPLSPISHRMSPPHFLQFDRFRRQIDSSPPPPHPRFREEFKLEQPRMRLHHHPDVVEYQFHRDRIDDRRVLGVGDRLEPDFDRDRHERYHPEVVMRNDFEMDSVASECVRGSFNDEVVVRGGREEGVLEENVNINVRRGGVSREVSRSPIKFRSGGIEVDDGLSNRGRKEEVQEYNNRGTPKKIVQKKSALLRLQPPKQQHSSSSNSGFRNRFDNATPSPHKGKESNLESLDRRISEERVRSPVELDVSFKSNALVAKMAASSSSGVDFNVNSVVSDSGTKIDGESPENYSLISKKEEKDTKNRARMSPILRRLGTQNNVEVGGNRSETSPVRSSSLSGRIARKASLKGEVLGKDEKNAGFSKVSSSPVRKKRRAISPLPGLSSLAPTKADHRLVNVKNSANHLAPTEADRGLVNVCNSANHPSDNSMLSDLSVKQSGKESGNIIGSTDNDISGTGKIDVNGSLIVVGQQEVVDHSVSDASAPVRMRVKKMLESLSGSLGLLGPGVSQDHENTKGYIQNDQRISNPDEDVTNSVDKCSSGTHTEKDGVKYQDIAPGLVNNGSVEGSSELVVVHIKDNVDSNDVYSGKVDTLNSVAVLSSVPVNVSNKEENIEELACPMVHADRPCETLVFSSSENATLGLNLDRIDVPELRHSENCVNLGSFSIDVPNDKSRTSAGHNDDDVTTDSKNINIVSDARVTNNIQEQQCQGSDTMLVNDEHTLGREGSSKSCMYFGGVLPFSVKEGSSLHNIKRKAETEPESLDSKIFESGHESAVSISFSIKEVMLPVEKHRPPVSGSSCIKSDASCGNEFPVSFLEGENSMNPIHDLDSIEYPSTCSKKRKILPLESVLNDAIGSESSDLPAFSDGGSVKHSPHLVEGFDLSKSVIDTTDRIGGSTSSLCAETSTFADNSKSDHLCKDSWLSIVESVPRVAEQSCFPESECNQIVDGNLMVSGAKDENELIALESACRMATNDRRDGLQCLPVDHTGDADQGPLSMDMDCDDNIACNAITSSLSGSQQSCGESSHDEATNMFDTPSNVGFPGVPSHFSPTLATSNANSAIDLVSGEKLSTDNKKSNQPLATQSSYTSKANLAPENQKNSSKLGTSTSFGAQPLTLKSVPLQSKHLNTRMSNSNFMSRQRRNVLTRTEASPSTSHRTIIHPSSKTQTYPAKPRTWHRTNTLSASNIPVKKPSVRTPLPHRPLYGKPMKVQDTSYIRKAVDRSKPNEMDRIGKMVGSVMIESADSPDGLVTGAQITPIEMPKTPPLPCSAKTPDNDIAYSGECTSSLYVDQSEETDNEEALKSADAPLSSFRDPESVVHTRLEDPGIVSDGDLLGTTSKRMIYIKRKSNQLIAASRTSQSSVSNMDKTLASSSDSNYYKRRKNQLIRASSEGNIQQMVAVNEDSSKSLSQRALPVYSGRSSTKRLSNKAKSSKFSLVWKLGDSKSCVKGVDALRSGRLLSHLLPWKRATYWSRKLLSSRKRGAVYVRSGRGFSLRRSKVTSLPGTSLKWSKSMEKRSKKVEEEAARAIAAMESLQKSGSSGVSSKAESIIHSSHKPVHGLKLNSGERIFRIGVFRYRMDPSRRTLQRITDEETSDFTAPKTERDARKTYVPKRLLIGSDEYVRIGNGNQLVRDPKRRTRILASEKVRWSLHTARMRLAKKRKFCQFFTRFGKCNKGEGKCPFIHDSSKIAVCTKFLNGLCADLNCKLTHKVIPERMPDCSFFLQGLCSNEKCPYRHVNVNPKASICESFLKGYCAEGNECRKKHSYICPEFEASGSCPQGSKCKLYHPKKGKAKKKKVLRDRKNAKGRYFGSSLSVADPETRLVLEKHAGPDKGSFVSQGEWGDFIDLDVSDDEARENGQTSEQTFAFEDDPLTSRLDDLDELMKPLRLLGRL